MKKMMKASVLILLGMFFLATASEVSAKEIQLRFSSAFPTMQTITGKIIKPWIDHINEIGKVYKIYALR